MRLLALVLALLATPAAADVCDDLWFTRNQVMDRAGYCFGSALGKALFDNADCTGKQVSLSRADQELVDKIRAEEKHSECAVDTGRTAIDLPDIAIRRQLVDLPLRSPYESSCFSWQASATPLFAGRSTETAIVGRIMPGDNLLWSHEVHEDAFKGDGSWSFVTVTRGEENARFQSAGWMRFKFDEKLCRQWAG